MVFFFAASFHILVSSERAKGIISCRKLFGFLGKQFADFSTKSTFLDENFHHISIEFLVWGQFSVSFLLFGHS
jgi:hypothetical protein